MTVKCKCPPWGPALENKNYYYYYTTCDEVCQWLVAGQWFSLGTPVPSTNKSACHNITEILLKVALNIKTPNPARAETILPFISETIPLYNVMYGSRTKAPPF